MKDNHPHIWKPNKDPEIDNLVCEDCGAIGFKQKDKDPFSETEGSAIFLIKPAVKTWDAMSIRGRSKWYKARQQMILTDVQKVGKHLARLKWDVPIGTWSRMMTGLKSSPKVVGKVTGARYIEDRQSIDDQTSQTIELPKLPAWSDNWPEAVQLQWLQNCKALAIIKALGV